MELRRTNKNANLKRIKIIQVHNNEKSVSIRIYIGLNNVNFLNTILNFI